jgi:exopolyphosphatase/guanosine-5'-triphosphate,3'-diphosphate pyrophosphatase
LPASLKLQSWALAFYDQISTDPNGRQMLAWAGDLHALGRSQMIDRYHEHAAYFIKHADMPGFSISQQTVLADLVAAQTGSLNTMLQYQQDPVLWPCFVAFRLAIMFDTACQYKPEATMPKLRLWTHELRLTDCTALCEAHPLLLTLLWAERDRWHHSHLCFNLDVDANDCTKTLLGLA